MKKTFVTKHDQTNDRRLGLRLPMLVRYLLTAGSALGLNLKCQSTKPSMLYRSSFGLLAIYLKKYFRLNFSSSYSDLTWAYLWGRRW
jgi:hypothetical protein